VRALSRRGPAEWLPELTVGTLRMAQPTRQVWRDDQEIQLTSKQFTVLEIFMRRPGEVLSRVALLDQGWDAAYDNRSNVVDVFIRSLRKKIDEPFKLTSLETVRGSGYRLRADSGTPNSRARRARHPTRNLTRAGRCPRSANAQGPHYVAPRRGLRAALGRATW